MHYRNIYCDIIAAIRFIFSRIASYYRENILLYSVHGHIVIQILDCGGIIIAAMLVFRENEN